MSSPSWNHTRPWIWQITVLIFIGIVAFFGIRPLLGSIQSRLDDIQRLLATRQYRSDQLKRLPDLEAQHVLIREKINKLNIILQKDRIVDFIQTLEELASANMVEIDIDSPDNSYLESKITEKTDSDTKKTKSGTSDEEADTPKKKVDPRKKETGIESDLPLKNRLKLNITVIGSYEHIVQYLAQLETLPYALDVTGIDMKERPEEGDRQVLESVSGSPFQKPSDEASPNLLPSLAVPLSPVLNGVFELVVYTQE